MYISLISIQKPYNPGNPSSFTSLQKRRLREKPKPKTHHSKRISQRPFPPKHYHILESAQTSGVHTAAMRRVRSDGGIQGW